MLPPEVTSALIHSGPGAGSLIAASTMWHELGAELEETARGYDSVLSSLADAWHGSSSAAMVTAAEPYIAWLRATAQQCQMIGSSAQTVVAAFELTHFTVVHPGVVAANRIRLAQLLATNFFGVNLPAIAETEAEYHAMWVNNAAAMFRYEATAASALVPPQFSSPPPVASPAALATQASLVPAVTTADSTARTAATVSLAAQTLTGFDPNTGWFGYFSTWLNQTFAAGGYPVNILGVVAQFATAKGFQSIGGAVGLGLAQSGADVAAAGASLASALSVGPASGPMAVVGTGVSIGNLMAPPAITGLLPASQVPVQLVAAASPLPVGQTGVPAIPVAPMVPRPATAGKGKRGGGRDYDDIEYGAELPGTVMKRPPSAG